MSATIARMHAVMLKEMWASDPSLDDYLEDVSWRYARGHITVDELEAKVECALRDGPPALWLQQHRTDRPGAVIYYDPARGAPSY